MKNRNVTLYHIFFTTVLLLLLFISVVFPQHITASYRTTAPEASLFFLDPGYINPAIGRGVLGMMSNPAGLYHVDGRQFSIAYTAPYVSSGNFNTAFVTDSEIYEPFDLLTEMQVEELGGLAGIGYVQQFNKWRLGLSVQQPRRGGIRFSANGNVNIHTDFDFEKALTRELADELPVDELPIRWDVDTQATLNFTSEPTDLFISVLPVMAGVSYSSKHFSIGAGLTYFSMSSSNEAGVFNTELDVHSTITGTPYGINPLTNRPWQGVVQADLDIQDNPVSAVYNFDVSGHRFAFTLGGMMNYKLLSIGASYSSGTKATIKGSYDVSTFTTVGYPEESLYSDIDLEFTDSEISGHMTLGMHEFTKDTVSAFDSGEIQMGGYHSFTIGAQFLFLGAFVGTQIPKEYPDLLNAHFGVYANLKMPFLPIRFNTGFIQCIDSITSSEDEAVPYRVTTHIGAGVAVSVPLTRWLSLGNQSSIVRVGVRSSLTSYALDVFEKEGQDTQDKELPSPLENLTISMGLDIPF